jgi:hypothetical protein
MKYPGYSRCKKGANSPLPTPSAAGRPQTKTNQVVYHNFGRIARKLKHINAPTTIPPRSIFFGKAPFVCMILAGILSKN